MSLSKIKNFFLFLSALLVSSNQLNFAQTVEVREAYDYSLPYADKNEIGNKKPSRLKSWKFRALVGAGIGALAWLLLFRPRSNSSLGSKYKSSFACDAQDLAAKEKDLREQEQELDRSISRLRAAADRLTGEHSDVMSKRLMDQVIEIRAIISRPTLASARDLDDLQTKLWLLHCNPSSDLVAKSQAEDIFLEGMVFALRAANLIARANGLYLSDGSAGVVNRKLLGTIEELARVEQAHLSTSQRFVKAPCALLGETWAAVEQCMQALARSSEGVELSDVTKKCLQSTARQVLWRQNFWRAFNSTSVAIREDLPGDNNFFVLCNQALGEIDKNNKRSEFDREISISAARLIASAGEALALNKELCTQDAVKDLWISLVKEVAGQDAKVVNARSYFSRRHSDQNPAEAWSSILNNCLKFIRGETDVITEADLRVEFWKQHCPVRPGRA